ncbi:hypothetical protein ACIP88_05090 [Streptomyces uncialis]|uniref:hypothetical protein n=1 Tax=Streptomyces uncialis TaxID=1048205 RepID=UPI0038124376
MSARDDLYVLLESVCLPKGHTPDRHIDRFAHELAERIRADADTLGDWDFTTRRDMRQAADLIDPEVFDA